MARKFGIKVSLEGKDVMSAEDTELSLTSDLALYKIVKSGGGTLDATGEVEIVHSLGYHPFCFVYREDSPGENKRRPKLYQSGEVGEGGTTVPWSIHTTALYIRGDENEDYSYHIMYDKLG